MTTPFDEAELPRPQQCVCERAIYRDIRDDVWRHYATDSEFCYPDLAYLESHADVARPNS